MSGGQRKRVTFADLVSARLPSTSPSNSVVKAENESTDAESLSNAATPATPTSESKAVASQLPAHAPVNVSETLHDPGPIAVVPQGRITGTKNFESVAPDEEFVRGTQHLTADKGQVLADRQPPSDSQSLGDSQPPSARRTFRPTGASQNDSQPSHDSQAVYDSLSPRDRQPLKEVKGYLKLPNTVVDSLLPTLDVYEQAAFIQLYRLSHGFGNYTCKISLPALQNRTGIKPTSMKQAISRLQVRGIVEKLAAEIGFGREQGITYWVSPDGRQTYGDWQPLIDRQSPGDDNKRKENLKEIISKGRLTPEQIKNCPDCHGVGMWYPEGPGKGVARCLHPGLRLKK